MRHDRPVLPGALPLLRAAARGLRGFSGSAPGRCLSILCLLAPGDLFGVPVRLGRTPLGGVPAPLAVVGLFIRTVPPDGVAADGR